MLKNIPKNSKVRERINIVCPLDIIITDAHPSQEADRSTFQDIHLHISDGKWNPVNSKWTIVKNRQEIFRNINKRNVWKYTLV